MYNIDGTVLLRFIHFLKPPEISYREVFFFLKPCIFLHISFEIGCLKRKINSLVLQHGGQWEVTFAKLCLSKTVY